MTVHVASVNGMGPIDDGIDDFVRTTPSQNACSIVLEIAFEIVLEIDEVDVYL